MASEQTFVWASGGPRPVCRDWLIHLIGIALIFFFRFDIRKWNFFQLPHFFPIDMNKSEKIDKNKFLPNIVFNISICDWDEEIGKKLFI